jgi:hypothetical protein
MTISREAVIWAYFGGREPESEAAIMEKTAFPNNARLVFDFMVLNNEFSLQTGRTRTHKGRQSPLCGILRKIKTLARQRVSSESKTLKKSDCADEYAQCAIIF